MHLKFKILVFYFLSFFNKRNFVNKFSLIYKINFWQNGSGYGSSIENTSAYNNFLVEFIKENKIENIIDIGCGDWQSSYLIYKNLEVNYVGFDCVKKIIDNNKINFPNYKFSFIDVLDDFNTIPNADLYIIKDVLQHWETEHIDVFLDNLVKLKKFKYILISNNANQNDDNADLKHFFGYGRGLSAKFLPLKKYNAEIVLEYYADEKKEISIIKQKSQ